MAEKSSQLSGQTPLIPTPQKKAQTIKKLPHLLRPNVLKMEKNT